MKMNIPTTYSMTQLETLYTNTTRRYLAELNSETPNFETVENLYQCRERRLASLIRHGATLRKIDQLDKIASST
jgi:hypothetical protein